MPQQQRFVTNLLLFLNFKLKNLARFGIFHTKWSITLKVCWFYLARCYQSKVKMWNPYSKSPVSVNLVKSLDPASFLILLPFSDIAIWVEYLVRERLSEIFQYCSPMLHYSWDKFTHFYAPSYQWRLSRTFFKSFLFFFNLEYLFLKWSFELSFNFIWKICIVTAHC